MADINQTDDAPGQVITGSLFTDETSEHDRAGVLAIAAEAAIEKGNFEEAESLYMQAIGLREKAHGLVHRRLVPLLNALAGLYTETQRFAEADKVFNRALDILQSCPKESKVREIEVLTNFSNMLRKAGRNTEAEHVESCLDAAKQEEAQAPLLLKLARGLTPSTSIDVRDFSKWLDQAAAAQPKPDSASASGLKVLSEQIQVPQNIKKEKPFNWKLALVVLLVVGWAVWFVMCVLM